MKGNVSSEAFMREVLFEKSDMKQGNKAFQSELNSKDTRRAKHAVFQIVVIGNYN